MDIHRDAQGGLEEDMRGSFCWQLVEILGAAQAGLDSGSPYMYKDPHQLDLVDARTGEDPTTGDVLQLPRAPSWLLLLSPPA